MKFAQANREKMAATAAEGIEDLLKEARLENLLGKFIEENIDIPVLCEASDADFTRLGVVRIGDRITIRDLAREASHQQQTVTKQHQSQQHLLLLQHQGLLCLILVSCLKGQICFLVEGGRDTLELLAIMAGRQQK